MNSLSDWVALVAAIEVTALAAFQILLAAGLPLGAAAFGGSNAVLPSRLRMASATSALVFLATLYVILARGGLFGSVGKTTPIHVAVWIATALFAVSALANIASPSRWEQFMMAPLGLLLAICCAILAIAP
jgi:membrane protease YdiL (CAAX protease family)